MPTIPEIKISIENKGLFVKDEMIKKGSFQRSANGSLIMYTGGFSAVFPVVFNNEKWAFRCWHANIGDTADRFRKIAECVKAAKTKYLCDLTYVDNGILVNGKLYPTMRMRWIEGQTIKDFLCSNAYHKLKLQRLAANFLSLIKDMHSRGFAHGDLQHGNILVDEYGCLYLVDYDSFYCPTLKGEKDIIKGLPDYQHPARVNNCFVNEKLDYFSELVIYISIVAIAENPNLVAKYQVADSDRLLFSINDYENIKSSAIYQDLRASHNGNILAMLSILEKYLSQNDINKLEPFDVLLERSQSFINTKSKFCNQCGSPYYKTYSRFCHCCGKLRT